MPSRLEKISRFLSFLLRHHPEAEGLRMDESGWVEVAALLTSPGARKRKLTRELLFRVVEENDKQRFELDEAGQRIRARQGHSLEVAIGWPGAVPPRYLYHGTSSRALPSIREGGLERRGRHHVHLSTDRESANDVGSRHGRPVVLRVRAGEMCEAGHEFRLSANGVWLVDAVPVEFLDLP